MEKEDNQFNGEIFENVFLRDNGSGVLYMKKEIDSNYECRFNEETTNITQPTESLPPPKRKRGRPSTIEGSKTWNDEETLHLIEVWGQYENLYQTKNKDFFNRESRQKALEEISIILKRKGIEVTGKQISKKLTDLKNYYGAQKRIVDGWVGAGSSWRFYKYLHFLDGSFTPRKSHKELNRVAIIPPERPIIVSRTLTHTSDIPPGISMLNNSARTEVPFNGSIVVDRTPITKIPPSRSIAVNKTPEPSTEHTQTTRSGSNTLDRVTDNSPDESFCDLLKVQLSMIPECDAKDDLRINMHQMVIKAKREITKL